MKRLRLTDKPPRHRRIAPRLASGQHRIPAGNGLPPIVKEAIRAIADAEGRSFSWVCEEILLDWARHHPALRARLKGDAVAYLPRKADQIQQQKEKEDDAARAAAAHARKAS